MASAEFLVHLLDIEEVRELLRVAFALDDVLDDSTGDHMEQIGPPYQRFQAVLHTFKRPES